MGDSGEFTAHLRQRVRAAALSLAEARAAHDDYLVDVRTGELESLRRMAAAHAVDLDEVRAGTDGTTPGPDVIITVDRPVSTASPAA